MSMAQSRCRIMFCSSCATCPIMFPSVLHHLVDTEKCHKLPWRSYMWRLQRWKPCESILHYPTTCAKFCPEQLSLHLTWTSTHISGHTTPLDGRISTVSNFGPSSELNYGDPSYFKLRHPCPRYPCFGTTRKGSINLLLSDMCKYVYMCVNIFWNCLANCPYW